MCSLALSFIISQLKFPGLGGGKRARPVVVPPESFMYRNKILLTYKQRYTGKFLDKKAEKLVYLIFHLSFYLT